MTCSYGVLGDLQMLGFPKDNTTSCVNLQKDTSLSPAEVMAKDIDGECNMNSTLFINNATVPKLQDQYL